MEPKSLGRRFLSQSPEATEALGEDLGKRLVPGAVLALDGDLGAGKTALIRGLARGLGVLDQVSSPTFTLMIEHEGRLPLFHFDAWMAGREALFLEGGGADYLGSEGVCAIEWAERIERYLPSTRLAIRMSHQSMEERQIECQVLVSAGEDSELSRALQGALAGVACGAGLSELSQAPGEPSGGPDVQA